MTQSDYVFLILDGYTQHKEYLTEHFFRAYKEAEKINIGGVEFFKRLIEANKLFVKNIEQQYYDHLNKFYMLESQWESEGKDVKDLQGQKPEMWNFSVLLHSFTNGRFKDHLWGHDINYINKAILGALEKITPIEPQTQSEISTMEENQMVRKQDHNTQNEVSGFDLTKYSLQTHNVYPYLKIVSKKNEYWIYEGATGNNRFQFFKIPSTSKAGKLCKQYNKKYIENSSDRENYIQDVKNILEACKGEEIIKETGLDAYLKYWKDCWTEKDKNIIDFHIIQHCEALKEWYNFKLERHVQENESLYLNEDVKKADIQKWKSKIVQRVENYLKQSESKNNLQFSAISSAHANELIKFYYWIQSKILPPPKTETISEQKKPEIKRLKQNNNYSLKQIAIAYSVMNILITSENADEILKKHSTFKSSTKLLQKRINKVSDLNKISGNKTTDTKHLNNLQAAKRLISGMKNNKAITDINRVITAFTTAYNNKD